MNIYTLDPRCIPAMEKVREYYLSIPEWQKDVREGKMFGVLIYSPTNEGPIPEGPTGPSPLPLHKGGEWLQPTCAHISRTLYSLPLWEGWGGVRLLPRGLLRYAWGQDMPTGGCASCL